MTNRSVEINRRYCIVPNHFKVFELIIFIPSLNCDQWCFPCRQKKKRKADTIPGRPDTFFVVLFTILFSLFFNTVEDFFNWSSIMSERTKEVETSEVTEVVLSRFNYSFVGVIIAKAKRNRDSDNPKINKGLDAVQNIYYHRTIDDNEKYVNVYKMY